MGARRPSQRSTAASSRPSSPPRRPARSRRSVSFRGHGFTVIMLAVAAVGILVLAPTLHTYFTQRQHIADLQQQVDAKQERVDDVRAQRARWDDPSYVRAQARERLLYVMPGETSYLVIDDRDDAEGDGDDLAPSDDVQKTPRDWVGTVASSLMSAGLTTASVPGDG